MVKAMRVSALVLIVGCLLFMPSPGQDKNCQSISLLLQANLDFTRPIPFTGWSGIVRGFLADTVPLNGKLYAAFPPDTYGTGQTGHDVNLSFVFDFGVSGKFVTVPDKGVFPLSPGVSPHMTYPPEFAFGHYAYTAKVAPGAVAGMPADGLFTNATGNISLSGRFLVNAPPPVDMGIWNAEINGKLCNVTPQP